jgi:hypothetical protein
MQVPRKAHKNVGRDETKDYEMGIGKLFARCSWINKMCGLMDTEQGRWQMQIIV